MGTIVVRVTPGARRTALAGTYGDLPKIALAAPPIDGRANDELVRFVAGATGVPRRSVSVIGGATSRTKRLRVEGVSESELRSALLADRRDQGR